MTDFAWGGPPVSGAIRTQPEDFRVTENIGYAPSGEGEHLWLWIEKRGANTVDVARDLARLTNVHPRAVSFAGLKDRNAVTRQPFSIHLPGQADPDWLQWPDQPFRVLSATRHARKIQRGKLAGNAFELVVRELDGDIDELVCRLNTIAERGVPNGFGEQRFGGNNIARARALFSGEMRRAPSKSKHGFYLSAARSLIFNQVLAERIAAGNWNRLIDGDIAMLDGTRSVFVADAADTEQQQRCEQLDLHPTGPLAGLGDTSDSTGAGAIEQAVFDRNQDLVDGLKKFQLKAERRALRMRVADLQWSIEEGKTLRLSFKLTRGCFATSVLREIIDYTDASRSSSGLHRKDSSS